MFWQGCEFAQDRPTRLPYGRLKATKSMHTLLRPRAESFFDKYHVSDKSIKQVAIKRHCKEYSKRYPILVSGTQEKSLTSLTQFS